MAATGFIFSAWTVFKRRDPTLAATYLVAAGVGQGIDWIFQGWLELYLFRPGLFNYYMSDSSIGAILAESFLVPSLAVLTAAYLPGWKGITLSTITVTALELLFPILGIYQRVTWQVWHTTVGFSVYFTFIESFRRAASRGGLSRGWTRIIFQGVLALWGVKIYWAIVTRIAMLITYNIDVMPNFARNQAFGMFILDAIVTFPLFNWVIWNRRQRRWPKLLLAMLVLFSLHYSMMTADIREYHPPWSPLLATITQSAWLYLLSLVNDFILSMDVNKNGR